MADDRSLRITESEWVKNMNKFDLLADEYMNELPAFVFDTPMPKGAEIAGWIDHTILKAEATNEQITKLCVEARENDFATVCVNPVNVKLCADHLAGAKSKVCSVIGFPLGASSTKVKVFETRQAIEDGASEIDMVINIGALRSGKLNFVFDEIAAINDAATNGGSLKVIVENCYLDQRQKILAAIMCRQADVAFIKTSTGFGPTGATTVDVEMMRRIVGPKIGVKAAGGIRTYADAVNMIKAGANRLGASASIAILAEAK